MPNAIGTNAIGPSFADELRAKGLGDDVSWTPGGEIIFAPTLSAATIAAVEAVYAAHNPNTVPKEQVAAAVQSWLDQTAQQYQYNDIVSAISYADDPTNALWQKQGQYFRSWRAQVWQALFTLQSNVAAGTATAPATIAALIASLPQPAVPTS